MTGRKRRRAAIECDPDSVALAGYQHLGVLVTLAVAEVAYTISDAGGLVIWRNVRKRRALFLYGYSSIGIFGGMLLSYIH